MKAEDNLQAACVRWFKLSRLGVIFAVPNGGSRNVAEAVKLKRIGVTAGVSDLIAILNNGKVLFIELKVGRNKQTELQKEFELRITELGHTYIVVRSFDEFRQKINENINPNYLPDMLLDANGYPTEEWLQFIENYQPDDGLPLIRFISEILPKGWYMAEWGFVLHRKYKGIRKLELHTGGWGGNELVISAIKSNKQLTHFKMRLVKWKAGGHYYFELSE